MSSPVLLLASCLLFAVLVAVGATASPEDGKSVAAVTTAPKSATASRQVVDGVLSMLGVAVPEASGEDDGSAEGDAGETKVATTSPGQRGIHKKKLLKWHLWQVYSWWAWAFAVVVIKFKVALLLIWGHLTYFVVALIRMLLREVPSWIQLKTAPGPAPYGPPPPAPYGPPPQYGPQYGQQQQQYAAASSYSPYKRRAGTTQTAAAGTDAASGGDLAAYAAHTHTQRK